MRALVPSCTDLLPPRKRFRESISLECSVEEYIDTDVLEDIKANATDVEVAVDRDVMTWVDASIDMEVDVEDEVEDKVESSDRGTMEVGVDVVVRIDIPVEMRTPDVVKRLEQIEEGRYDVFAPELQKQPRRYKDQYAVSMKTHMPYPLTVHERLWKIFSMVPTPRKPQYIVMADLVISISSDVSVKSVRSSFSRLILIGSISVEVPIAPKVGATAVASPVGVLEFDTHSSSEADPSKSSPISLEKSNTNVIVSKGSPITTTERIRETYKNVSQDIRDQLNAKAEAVQIILTEIDNDIYSTVDACPNACEMWKAIERKWTTPTSLWKNIFSLKLKKHAGEVRSLTGKLLRMVRSGVLKIFDNV
nr:hypothetical protein [Tanacetum cinerariifolium]